MNLKHLDKYADRIASRISDTVNHMRKEGMLSEHPEISEEIQLLTAMITALTAEIALVHATLAEHDIEVPNPQKH